MIKDTVLINLVTFTMFISLLLYYHWSVVILVK